MEHGKSRLSVSVEARAAIGGDHVRESSPTLWRLRLGRETRTHQ